MIRRGPTIGMVALTVLISVPGPVQVPGPVPAEAAGIAAQQAPGYVVDAPWPRDLPNKWILGQVSGIAVDTDDHVWILQRPGTLTEREAGAAQDPPLAECCIAAPPVIELDAEGNVLRAWGGKNQEYHWPDSEHGLFIDAEDNVWITGYNRRSDHIVQKFSPDGDLLLEIGEPGRTGGSNDTRLLGRPTDIAVDSDADEVYIADGYANRRVIVFDATTGAYKRHWGAYGERPHDDPLEPYDPDAPPSRSFSVGCQGRVSCLAAVHAVRIADDGLVYVADRANNRIQVFRKDGTFVQEARVAPNTLAMGSVWDIDFSADADQTWVFVPDGTNMKVWILRRSDLATVGSFGRGGRQAGQFNWVHNLAVDSRGRIYTSEVSDGKRVQRFLPADAAGAGSGGTE